MSTLGKRPGISAQGLPTAGLEISTRCSGGSWLRRARHGTQWKCRTLTHPLTKCWVHTMCASWLCIWMHCLAQGPIKALSGAALEQVPSTCVQLAGPHWPACPQAADDESRPQHLAARLAHALPSRSHAGPGSDAGPRDHRQRRRLLCPGGVDHEAQGEPDGCFTAQAARPGHLLWPPAHVHCPGRHDRCDSSALSPWPPSSAPACIGIWCALPASRKAASSQPVAAPAGFPPTFESMCNTAGRQPGSTFPGSSCAACQPMDTEVSVMMLGT